MKKLCIAQSGEEKKNEIFSFSIHHHHFCSKNCTLCLYGTNRIMLTLTKFVEILKLFPTKFPLKKIHRMNYDEMFANDVIAAGASACTKANKFAFLLFFWGKFSNIIRRKKGEISSPSRDIKKKEANVESNVLCNYHS